MEPRDWKVICHAIRSSDRRVPRVGRRKRFSDPMIVRMYCWTVAHDRPMCWGCDRKHYTNRMRPKQLPSVSQFSRRLRSVRVQTMLKLVNEYLTRSSRDHSLSFLDGKAVPLNRSTRDKDARKGYCDGHFVKGYKIHARASGDGAITDFCVRPLNEAEPRVAHALVTSVPPGALVLADANYDSAALYEAVHRRDAQLFTPLKGMSKRPERLRRMGEGRRIAVQWWQEMPSACKRLVHVRAAVERVFSAFSCCGGGFTTLPPWARGLHRVTSWITAKIILYNARVKGEMNLRMSA